MRKGTGIIILLAICVVAIIFFAAVNMGLIHLSISPNISVDSENKNGATAASGTVSSVSSAVSYSVSAVNAVAEYGRYVWNILKYAVSSLVEFVFSVDSVRTAIVYAIIFFVLGKLSHAIVNIFRYIMYIMAAICIVYAILATLGINIL